MLPRLSAAAAVGLLGLALLAAGVTAKQADWSKAQATPLVQGLDFPTDLDIAPDGTVWFVELKGNVSRINPETGEREILRQVADVVTGVERGMSGFALAKDFATTGDYFLFYTKANDDPDGGTSRLVRIHDGQEILLLEGPAYKEHNGGRILVDPDGNLFVGLGELQQRDPSQDLDSNLGKILHMTPDGQPVAGNLRGLVYSYGHRNPYGLAYNQDTGELWETENSGWRRDEVNIIVAGANYGYPECEGHGLNGVSTPCPTDKGYTFPIVTFYEDRAAAPTGAAFWNGDFYWASLNEGSIHQVTKAANGTWQDRIVFTHGPPLLDLHAGPDGKLYFASVEGIYRLEIPLMPGETIDEGPSDTTSKPANTGKATSSSKGAGDPLVPLTIALVAAAALLHSRRSS